MPTTSRPGTSEEASASVFPVAKMTMSGNAERLVELLPRLQQLQAQVSEMAHLIQLLVAQGDATNMVVKRASAYLAARTPPPAQEES